MHSKLLTTLAVFLAIALLGSALAGCGQKGDLYLPEAGKPAKRN